MRSIIRVLRELVAVMLRNEWLKRVHCVAGCWIGDGRVSKVRILRVSLPEIVTWI